MQITFKVKHRQFKAKLLVEKKTKIESDSKPLQQ